MKKFIKRSSLIVSIFLIILLSNGSIANAEPVLNANDSSGNMTVQLDGDGHYFVELNNISPGEHYYKKLTIRNKHIYPYDVYFKIASEKGVTGKSLELLKYINMKILYNRKEIYNGTADGRYMKDIMLLGTSYPGTKNRIDVYVDISKDLDNSFSNLETFNRFDFYSNINYSDINKNNNGEKVTNTIDENNTFNPKTGDNFKFYFYLISIILCIIVLILLNKKESKKDV
ncbi:hypothetical protein ACFO6R_10790 [Eubacterium multiforme]|uniref:LPXTG-motif cell wall anchor domain-containing protein n=1 Tax=Eubacterium multiforme TaxID=83339 RepID=A0ABT9UVE5_9FIRM|nr:hypothetical protein [Eubacterium multiforme]MDQ0150280.1 hypothetical protein [Eubacterium multiforme]